MTGLAKLDHLQRWSRIFQWDRTDIAASTDFGIWTCLEQCLGPSSLVIRTLGNQWIHCLENKKKSCDKIKCLCSLKIQAAQPQYTCGHCHYSNGREHNPPGGTPPYISYIGMCHPIGYLCAVLVWKRVQTLPILGLESGMVFEGTTGVMNVFIVSISNEKYATSTTTTTTYFI